MLQHFPECIQADLTYQLYHKVFTETKALEDASESCMRALSMKFKTITLQQKNYLIRHGEELNKLFIVGRKGALEILLEGNLVGYFSKYLLLWYCEVLAWFFYESEDIRKPLLLVKMIRDLISVDLLLRSSHNSELIVCS